MSLTLDDMKQWIIALVVVILFGAIATVTLDEFRQDIRDDLSSATRTNETITWTNNTCASVHEVDTLTGCTGVWNGTDGILIGAGNYTCSRGCGIKIIITDSPAMTPTANVLVTYAYGLKDTAYNISEVGIEAESNVSSYFGTMGTIFGIAVLLGIILGVFYLWKR